jgi:asparagine synthase (glutamine-hydrolysing)
MIGTMQHESFYSTRTLTDEQLGVYVGWTARRGAFDDAGPVRSATGDVALVFSGVEHGGRGSSASNLLEACEADSDFPRDLNGRFHGVVIDRRRGTVSVFNDRFSMHRLYVHESRDTVYFAAEAKAILAVRPECRTVDPRGLAEAVTMGCVVENRTLFDGIHVLPGGSRWTFEHGRLAKKAAYFRPEEWEEQPRLDPQAFYGELKDAFSQVLPRYFGGREPIGMSLTGGLDTRMIMAWQRCPPGSLPCYTWGGMYRECQDVTVAREVARACLQPAHVITLGPTFLARFADYAERAVWLTDGCVDVSAAGDVYMNEHARTIAPARMTGLYGGEVLRRVRSFKPVLPTPGLFHPDLLPWFDRARETYATIVDGHPASFAVFRQAPWHHHSNLSLEETQVTIRAPFLDNAIVKVAFRAPEAAATSNDASFRLIQDGNAALSAIPTDRGLGGRGALAQRIAHATQEFSFKAEYAYDYGMPQWLARTDHLLSPLRLERLFLGRHKPLHYRIWYRRELAAYVKDVLLDSRSLARPWIDPKQVELAVSGHIKGDRNYTTEIHKLLTLELLHRRLVDAPIAESTCSLASAV